MVLFRWTCADPFFDSEQCIAHLKGLLLKNNLQHLTQQYRVHSLLQFESLLLSLNNSLQ